MPARKKSLLHQQYLTVSGRHSVTLSAAGWCRAVREQCVYRSVSCCKWSPAGVRESPRSLGRTVNVHGPSNRNNELKGG